MTDLEMIFNINNDLITDLEKIFKIITMIFSIYFLRALSQNHEAA